MLRRYSWWGPADALVHEKDVMMHDLMGGGMMWGHVPAPAIRRLLAEKPQAIGLAVPARPAGSPCIEVEGMEPDTYEMILFGPSGQRTFARYRGSQGA